MLPVIYGRVWCLVWLVILVLLGAFRFAGGFGGLICFSCAFTLGGVGLCYRFDA